MAVISDWRELPFREIWCVDFEFYPGLGLTNGSWQGDAATPRDERIYGILVQQDRRRLVPAERRTRHIPAFGVDDCLHAAL